MTRRSRVVARLLLAAALTTGLCVSGAQNVKEESKAERRRRDYPGMYSVFDLAQAAPAELRALALLRLGSQAIRDREWREELLEGAFEAAGRVHLVSPVAVVAPPEGRLAEPDSERLMRVAMLNAGVDRLTLQSAVVRALAPLNFGKALALFERLDKPGADGVSCASVFVPLSGEYFEAAAALADGAVNERERARILQTAVGESFSVSDAAPALKLLQRARLSEGNRTEIAVALAGGLASVRPNSRAWAAEAGKTTDAMGALVDGSTAVQRRILLQAWRAYLATALSGPQCAEIMDVRRSYLRWRQAAVEAFNKHARTAEDVAPLTDDDVHPAKIEPGFSAESPEFSPAVREIKREWWRLVFGEGHQGLSDVEKASAEWKAAFLRQLNRIEELKDSETGAGRDNIWMKARFISGLIAISPAGQQRDLAMQRYLQLMTTANVLPEQVWEWYWSVKNWIASCDVLGFAREDVLAGLDASGHPWLRLMSAIERLG